MQLTANRFTDSPYKAKSFAIRTEALTTDMKIVRDGVIMDPFYRNTTERPRGSGREKHLGADITGETSGNRSITDPRRGLPVYAAINTQLQLDALSRVRAYNKDNNTEQTGLPLPATGVAEMQEARVAVQPWSSMEDHSYGGIVAFSCIYNYAASQQFTLYVEFLHLITQRFLPKDASGRIATLQEWTDTGRGIGFGPEITDNATVPPSFFQGPEYALVGYLGATQTPHVHVQVAFFPGRSFSRQAHLRLDPMMVVY